MTVNVAPLGAGSVRLGVGTGIAFRHGGLLSLDKVCGNRVVSTPRCGDLTDLSKTNFRNNCGRVICRVINRPLNIFCLPRDAKLISSKGNKCACNVTSLGNNNIGLRSNRSHCITKRTIPGAVLNSGVDFHCGRFSLSIRVGKTFNRGVCGKASLACVGVGVFPSCGIVGSTPGRGVGSRATASC